MTQFSNSFGPLSENEARWLEEYIKAFRDIAYMVENSVYETKNWFLKEDGTIIPRTSAAKLIKEQHKDNKIDIGNKVATRAEYDIHYEIIEKPSGKFINFFCYGTMDTEPYSVALIMQHFFKECRTNKNDHFVITTVLTEHDYEFGGFSACVFFVTEHHIDQITTHHWIKDKVKQINGE